DPRRVGKYRLIRRLGSGAHGRVYLGRTPDDRLMAIKMIRDDLADDPQFRRRFAREVEILRQVHGLYTTPLVDADPLADPPWLATTFVPGPTLRQVVDDDGGLPPDTVRTLGAGLAEALLAIHAAGIVHRDVKPDNVLIAADGPRLIDFGIARVVNGTRLTTGADRLGTPPFMAPEAIS